ncbi:MAG: hypothetical protein MJ187_01385 [Alphaproteobacteria bacterium]|nr:hypothetical protein [Alphaproteobacteria bacterium]
MNKFSCCLDEKNCGMREKIEAYEKDCVKGKMAFKQVGTELKNISLRTLAPNEVEFIAGEWRIQNKLSAKIVTIAVQNKEQRFVLGERLPNAKKNFFEYYKANVVGSNCYGNYVTEIEMIIGKYETNRATYWAFGNNIEEVNNALWCKLGCTHAELIHSVESKKNAVVEKIYKWIKSTVRI